MFVWIWDECTEQQALGNLPNGVSEVGLAIDRVGRGGKSLLRRGMGWEIVWWLFQIPVTGNR